MRLSKGEAASIASAALLAVLAIIWIATHDVDINLDVYTKAKWERWGDKRAVVTVYVDRRNGQLDITRLARGQDLFIEEPAKHVVIKDGSSRAYLAPGAVLWLSEVVAKCAADSLGMEWARSIRASSDTVYTRRGTDASD